MAVKIEQALGEKRSLNDNDEVPRKKRYNFRKKVELDYSALNEGEDKKSKFFHPHIALFEKEFEKCLSNVTEDMSMTCSEYCKRFDDIDFPLKIYDPENSGMVVSTNNKTTRDLTVDDITQAVGDDYFVNVIDVQSQENERWSLREWCNYFNKPAEEKDRIRNVISLEVSHVEDLQYDRPDIVDDKDLVDIVWNNVENLDTENDPRPKVTKYCLMSVKNAFTDYHLDFAGTSVYYNLAFGKKKFILYPPTPENIENYIEWSTSTYQNMLFLGEKLTGGVAMELNGGDLFMIPSGYIHVVYTPEDSLIFGGNYLTFRDISQQLKIVDVEKQTGVTKRYTFPMFDEVMGRTCEWLCQNQKKGKQMQVKKETVNDLISYMKSGKTKYKPTNFINKKQMLQELSNLYL